MLIFIFCVRFFELITELAICSAVVSGVCSLYYFDSVILTTETSNVLSDTKILLKILVCNSRIFFLIETLRYNYIICSQLSIVNLSLLGHHSYLIPLFSNSIILTLQSIMEIVYLLRFVCYPQLGIIEATKREMNIFCSTVHRRLLHQII